MTMKKILILLLLLPVIKAQAKWTLVPRYSSYISISEQGDTIDVSSSYTTLYKDDSQGMFRVAIIHETLTKKRIKYIYHAETMAALSMLSASLSAVTTIGGDWTQRYRGRLAAYIDGTLADIYNHNVSAARALAVEAWIENTCQEEIMIADQEHGQVWYLMPGQAIRFTLHNPDILLLRISNINHERRHFVIIAAGSLLRNAQVEMETEEEYVFPQVEADGDGFYNKVGYVIFDKMTAIQKQMSPDEYKAFKRNRKQ